MNEGGLMELNLQYVHSESIGYGRLGVKLAEALEAKGVTVYDHMPPPAGVDYDETAAQGRRSGTADTVCWVSVPSHASGWWDSQRTVVFTMWEAMRLPESFRESLHVHDMLLVPSDQNVELFSEYHPNVRRVLLGVDPADWFFVERTAPGRWFDFLIGGSGARKGTDLAFEAFKRAFPTADGSGPIPRLVMKNPRGEPFEYDGRVEVIAGKLSAEDERDLYARSHCYLQPSRGEGFGLQPLQAIAQGLPTILTDAHGHESFAHLGHGISAKAEKANYFIYGDAGDWWEPDLDELVDQMRWVYANYDEAAALARAGAGVVAAHFTWANTADQFLQHVPLGGEFKPGEWVQPERLKFRVRTLRDMTLDIAERRIVLKGGVDYWELADVKRILADGGALDPECLEVDDRGLPDAEVPRNGQSDYCPHCDQRYGSGLTRGDDAYLASEAVAR